MKRTLSKIGVGLLAAVSLVLLLIKSRALITITDSSTAIMAVELAVLFVWFFAAGYKITSPLLKYGISILAVWLYLWMHRIAIPVVVSGLYAAILCTAGEAVLMFASKARPIKKYVRLSHDFLLGSAIQISIICIMNAFGIGGAGAARIESLILAAVSVGTIFLFRFTKKRIDFPVYEQPSDKELEEEKKSKLWICLAAALLITMCLLQAGRINIALDYDSLHYGLRSEYILDVGHGIYENLGSVNDVYVYPKGLEILSMPLNVGTTYGCVLAFNFWICIGVLMMMYGMVRSRKNRRTAILAAAILSTIPGIMNMAISAKTDIITLFFQLVIISDVMIYLKPEGERKTEYLVTALAAALFTINFKPTAAFFTFIIAVISLIFIIKENVDARKSVSGKSCQTEPSPLTTFLAIGIPVVLSVAGVMARTIAITGLPMTSAATSFFNAIGINAKYPFYAADAFGDASFNVIKRWIGLFLCSIGDDNTHIYIAWGSVTVTVLLLIGIIRTIRKPKEDLYIRILTGTMLIASVILAAVLWQIDGNYFVLLYALSILACFDADDKVLLIPAVVLGIIMCMITNWAGATGLTPIKMNHYGFYDHASDRYDISFAEGNKEIFEYLERDRTQRVLAMSEQPACFNFRCNVQSYTDLEGSGGNVRIVKTLDQFKEFLAYCRTDYIYTNDDFLAGHSRASDIVGYMIEDGSLILEIDEGRNKLYRIDLDAKPVVKAAEAEPEIEEVIEEPEEEGYLPTPTELNLVTKFPDGSDQTNALDSYAGIIYEELAEKENQMVSQYVSLAESNQYSNVNLVFYNADGALIDDYSLIQDIMSMASVYAYYHDPMNETLTREYADALWDNAHGVATTQSGVYYCDGCVEDLSATPVAYNPAASSAGPENAPMADMEDYVPIEWESSRAHPMICPGHVDLNVAFAVRSINDVNSLFTVDTIGNAEENMTDTWHGWTEETIAEARELASSDWEEKYGLTTTFNPVSSSLTPQDIQVYLNLIPDGTSQDRMNLIKYALKSVGKIPYLWGGKAHSAGFVGNNFGSPVKTNEGFKQKGLDCSGWIQWVYLSALGRYVDAGSTTTLVNCGTPIAREDLKAGDIMIRIGDERHVAMFIGWTDEGKMVIIHENSGFGNVGINVVNSNWPYYRRILD